jgi:hypothetical protein
MSAIYHQGSGFIRAKLEGNKAAVQRPSAQDAARHNCLNAQKGTAHKKGTASRPFKYGYVQAGLTAGHY